MCQRITCGKCGRPSYTGCGQHVEQVLRDVPPEQRCQCRAERSAVRDAAAPAGRSWLSRLWSK